MENKCCENTYSISPSSYNSSNVVIKVPQVFSPDKDGISDIFKIDGKGWIVKSIKIRKGKSLIYESTNSDYWDGTYKGKALSNNIYKYEVILNTINSEDILLEGDVCLFNVNRKMDEKINDDFMCHCNMSFQYDEIAEDYIHKICN